MDKKYNYRTKTYMTKEEAWSCCCEDFMPEQHGVEKLRLVELNKDENYYGRTLDI